MASAPGARAEAGPGTATAVCPAGPATGPALIRLIGTGAMADRRTRAEKLAAMAAQSASPNEAEIAAQILAESAADPVDPNRGLERGLPTFAATPERNGRVVIVTVVDQSEEAAVDDYGPFAGVLRGGHRGSARRGLRPVTQRRKSLPGRDLALTGDRGDRTSMVMLAAGRGDVRPIHPRVVADWHRVSDAYTRLLVAAARDAGQSRHSASKGRQMAPGAPLGASALPYAEGERRPDHVARVRAPGWTPWTSSITRPPSTTRGPTALDRLHC